MAANERWYFDLEQIHSTPSIKSGYDHDKELSCRQQAANFIQDMGQRLQVNQLCINTAIVYMHRFYMFHSFQRFHKTSLASAALFLAAKVEEQPRKLEHVIRFAQICLHKEQIPFDVNSQAYMEQVQDLIMNENILLQTLGFDVAIDHPHTHIVRCCQLVRASKDLAQTSYFMASYSLHLTSMCLQYKPTVVACFCIHLACKWSNWEIPDSSEGKPWFWYVDKSVTSELLENLTAEFLNLFEKCPSRLKKKIMALSTYSNVPQSIANLPMSGPPMQIGGPSQQQDSEMKKKDLMAIESHNPLNQIPHPIGRLGAAVAEAKVVASMNSIPGAGTGVHPFHHQNPMVNRHGCEGNLMKKHLYDHNQRSSLPNLPPNLPPPSSLNVPGSTVEPPYKKPHHPSHNQRESHNISVVPGGVSSSGNKPSCMFEPPLPPQHKSLPFQQHSSSSSSVDNMTNQLLVHPNITTSRGSTNHVPQPHRSSLPSRPTNIRNGEAHYQDKKYPDVKRESLDSNKPQPLLGPPVQIVSRMKTKTPPPQLNLAPPQVLQSHQIKPERSIFSPEEKVTSPLQLMRPVVPILPPTTTVTAPLNSNLVQLEKVKKESPPPTPRTPVQIKKEKESPPSDGEGHQLLAVPALTQDSSRQSREHSAHNTGESGKERLAIPPVGASPRPVGAPDTPSKSSHKKKKKKHKDHKDKHKDKHKHKHRLKDPEPIVITIPKDKITISHPEGLKIKIAKEKISNPPSTTGLKLKISKDKLVKESKKRERSDGEEEDSEQQVTKQHRPNGTTTAALQVTTQSNRFSSVLGKSIVSPIRTPNSFKYECSPPVSPAHIPEYSPTKSGTCLVKTPGHSPHCNETFRPSPTKPCLSPIAATPRYSSPESKSQTSTIQEHFTKPIEHVSPPFCKPFLSPIAATPRRQKKSKYRSKPNLVVNTEPHTTVSELAHMSPIQNKPFLSPIAATPVHTAKTKTFKSPPISHVYCPKTPDSRVDTSECNEIPHISPLRAKPFLSPIAPTPRHSSKTKTFKSPPTQHVYVPLPRSASGTTELSHIYPVESKPFLSPIAPTPRHLSPKQSNSPPVEHCYIPLTSSSCVSDHVSDASSSDSSFHSSPDHSLSNNKNDSTCALNDLCNPVRSYDAHHTSPVLSPPNLNFQETEHLVSPIQTPAHCHSNKISPPYSRNVDFTSQGQSYQSSDKHFSEDQLVAQPPIEEISSTDLPLSFGDNVSKNAVELYISDDTSDLKPSYQLDPLNQKGQSSGVKSSPVEKNNKNRDPSPIYSGLESIRSSCFSPISRVESGEKCLLSPIMTPGRSPLLTEISKEKPISPHVIPRYSPTDPNHFRVSFADKERTTQVESCAKQESPKPLAMPRRGPRTPPTPCPLDTPYNYDPITPARPDPNEIIFKDSNDNHTSKPSPSTTQEKKFHQKKFVNNQSQYRRAPLLPDFKIPKTNNQMRRREPNMNPWIRTRGRGNHPPYCRGARGGLRAWNRWESNQHRPMPMRPPVPPPHDRSVHSFYRPDEHQMPFQSQDMNCYEPLLPGPQDQPVLHMFDSQQPAQGIPYDNSFLKRPYNTMGVNPEYYMHYQQVYIPSFPPPPPLPDEPPPPQPPPPPPPS